jgi:hypothetical protein
MREPVIETVKRHLFLLASIRMHAPYLHLASTFRVEIDIFAIR